MASTSSNDGEEDCSVEQQSAVLRTNGIPPLLSIVAFISQVWKYFMTLNFWFILEATNLVTYHKLCDIVIYFILIVALSNIDSENVLNFWP